MAKAAPPTIADGVVAYIKAHLSNQWDFTCERSYAEWDLELKEMDSLEFTDAQKLRVDVAAHTTSQTLSLQTRGGKVLFSVPIDIAVRRKFGPDKKDEDTGRVVLAEIDNLVLLVQRIQLLFTPVRLREADEEITWKIEGDAGLQTLVNPHIDHLRHNSQFTSILRATFNMWIDS